MNGARDIGPQDASQSSERARDMIESAATPQQETRLNATFGCKAFGQ